LGVFYFFGLGEFLSDFLKREIWREILRETLNNREIFVRLSEPLKNERMKERDSNFMRENERVLLFERI
jgi:gluconate kinase